MKNTAVAVTAKKTKRGVSFVARVNKIKTENGLLALLDRRGEFPCYNPQTARRRKRAVNAKLEALGSVLRVRSTNLRQLITTSK